MSSPNLPPSSTPDSSATAITLQRGDKVGDFVVKQIVASGGTSTVYRAHDPLLDRQVAIKQLLLSSGGDNTASAIHRAVREEAALHQRVSAADPNHLVGFIGVYEHANGLMLVSEFYPSTSLETLLQTTAAPMSDLRQALGILAATAKGLEAIHAQGVIHRDLKPANILMGRDGGLKICDFGLAAVMEAQEALSLGSVRYMAPELLRSEPADGRADLYALGLIAYELLAGRPNFDNAFRNVLRDERHRATRWMKWHTNLKAIAPPLSQYRPELPDAVVSLVGRLMEKDPSRRVDTATATVDAIRRHFVSPQQTEGADGARVNDMAEGNLIDPTNVNATNDQPAPSVPHDTHALAPVKKWPKRLAIGLVACLVVGGIALAIDQQNQSSKARAARDSALAQMQKAKSHYESGDFDSSRKEYAAVLDAWPAESDIARGAQAGVWRAKGRLAFSEGHYDDAITQFELFRDSGSNAKHIEPLIREARDASAFSQLTDDIQVAIKEGRFRDAQQTVLDARQTTWTDTQTTTLDGLDDLIDKSKAAATADAALAQAQQLAENGDNLAAIAALSALPALTPKGDLYLKQLQHDQQYTTHINTGEAAVADADWTTALVALQAANELEPSAALQQRIDQVKSRQFTLKGQQHLAAGDAEASATAFAAALELDPTNTEALAASGQIAANAEVAALLREGDTALGDNAPAKAVGHFTAALALDPANAVVQTRLTQARVAEALAVSRTALESDDLPGAQAALEHAAAIAPDDAAVLAATEALKKTIAYAELLVQGDAARDTADYPAARRLYAQAQTHNPTDEIALRLKDAEFLQFIAQARSLIERSEYQAALAMLKQAQRIRVTPELMRLIDEVNAKLNVSLTTLPSHS